MKKRMKTPAFIAIWTSAAVVLLALGIAFMLMATTFSNVFVQGQLLGGSANWAPGSLLVSKLNDTGKIENCVVVVENFDDALQCGGALIGKFAGTSKDISNSVAVILSPGTLYAVGTQEGKNINGAEGIASVKTFIGEEIDMERKQWIRMESQFINRRILITKPELNGKRLGQLKLRKLYGINITRINRAGMDLVATPGLTLQVGDRVNVVGTETAVSNVEKLLGNSMKRLNEPNLLTIFVGIALGIILGSIPIAFPGIPQPVKLGLAGGPLIVAILISRFGYHYKLITYTTQSANFMLREIGITLFLACVGISAGDGFVETIVNNGGLAWVGYGFIITFVPLMIVGCIGRYFYKVNYFTLMGLIAGSTTDPPALAYSNATAGNDAPSVGYATVYPLAMFLRVLTAQLLILFFC